MLHLSPYNLLIQKTITEAVEANWNGKPLILDRIISDFDYTTFHINTVLNNSNVDPENIDKSIFHLSIVTKAWESIAKLNNGAVFQFIKEKYSNLDCINWGNSTVNNRFNLTLQIELNKITENNLQSTLEQLSLLKNWILSFPFELSFIDFNELSKIPVDPESVDNSLSLINAKASVYQINYRENENIFIKASNDRITVIFEVSFKDETDKIFGKVFLQEFVDSRKRNHSIQSSPQVLVSNNPPMEILGQSNQTNIANDNKFITFILFPRHFSDNDLKFLTTSRLLLFRNYFHYHIKCSKAYMHSRMRYRVNNFIKVLNRAKVDDEDDEDAKKENEAARRTITGRKFVH